MRALSHVLAIVLIASLGIAAVLLLVTGKGFVYLPGAGSTRSMEGVISTCAIISIAAVGVAVTLHGVARFMPKQYFLVTRWRDIAWVISLLGALGAVYAEIVGVATYGAF